jgi:uncharacterized protein YigE (DUF2233 family)
MLTIVIAFSSLYSPFYIFGSEMVSAFQVIDSRNMTLAHDVTYNWFDMRIGGKPEKVHTLEFDPNNTNLELEVSKTNGYVYGLQRVTGAVNDNDREGNRVIAAINGDFYNMTNGLPIGLFMNQGEILVSPPDDWFAFGIKEDNTTVVGESPLLRRELRFGEQVVTISHINRIRPVSEEGLVLYTADFYTSTMTNDERDEYIFDVVSGDVKSHESLILTLVEVRKNAGNSPIKEGQVVLSATGKFRNTLSALTIGETVLTYFQLEDNWKDVKMAVGGEGFVVKNGEVVANKSTTLHPRVAIGVKADGKIVMTQVDGRQSGISEGLTLQELGQLMKDLGAINAIYLDGGGSATFVGRLPGATAKTILNIPSDGSERRVANSILLIDKSPELGEAAKFVIQPEFARVLVGSSYQLKSAAIDANYHPVAYTEKANWLLLNDELGVINAEGTFTASKSTGTVKVYAYTEDIFGVGDIQVVADITDIQLSQSNISVAAGATKSLSVKALRNGQEIYSTPNAFTWRVEGSIGTVDANGIFTASNVSGQTGKVIVKYTNPVNGKVIEKSIEVTIGLQSLILEDFESGLSKWKATGVRYNKIGIFEETNKEYVKSGNKSLRVEYDFKGTVGTSGVYVESASAPIEIPGNPVKIGMWVYGDGSGNWLRSQLRDGNNQPFYVDFVPSSTGIDFVGWKYVEANIPSDKTFPLKMELPVRYMGITDSKKNAGTIYIDDITVIYTK